jgi:hypothetical protein
MTPYHLLNLLIPCAVLCAGSLTICGWVATAWDPARDGLVMRLAVWGSLALAALAAAGCWYLAVWIALVVWGVL